MEKKNLDWKHIGFAYHTTDYRYVADYKDGNICQILRILF